MASVTGERERHLGNVAGVHRATEMLHTSLCGRGKRLHLGQVCPCQRAGRSWTHTTSLSLEEVESRMASTENFHQLCATDNKCFHFKML